MDKKDIKIKLQEAIGAYILLSEAGGKLRKAKHKSGNGQGNAEGDEDKERHNQQKAGKKDYADVQRAFKRLGGPSMVDIMIMIGIPDDKVGTNRSLFRKKVLQKKNKDTGSIYQFDDEELDKVRAAIDSQK